MVKLALNNMKNLQERRSDFSEKCIFRQKKPMVKLTLVLTLKSRKMTRP